MQHGRGRRWNVFVKNQSTRKIFIINSKKKLKEKKFWANDILWKEKNLGESHTLFPKMLVQAVKLFE